VKIVIIISTILSMRCAFAADSTNDLGPVIKQYLLDHPEVVAESLQRYYLIQQAEQGARTKAAIAAHEAELLRDAESPGAGSPAAPVTIVEFFDYRCGYCKHAAPIVLKTLEGHADVRLVFKELPLLGADSEIAAKAALASHRQGAYLKFHEALMNDSGPLTLQGVERIASELGLDLAKLREDMESTKIREAIERNKQLAKTIRVASTPSFVVAGELLAGLSDGTELQALIEKAEQALRK